MCLLPYDANKYRGLNQCHQFWHFLIIELVKNMELTQTEKKFENVKKRNDLKYDCTMLCFCPFCLLS